jgi:type II secretory pathway component GspD/PulD (secretin)
MPQITIRRCVAALILASALGLYAASGQEPASPKPGPISAPAQATKSEGTSGTKSQRTVYVVKHGAAKALATTLAQHFKGVAEVQVLADSPSNCLLISAAPAVYDEAIKLLDQLDRRPQLVSVLIWVAEFTPKKSSSGNPAAEDKELDENAFACPIKEVGAKLEALQKKGTLSALKRIQLSTVENQTTTVLLGDAKPYVTGVNTDANGKVNRILQYRNVGTNVVMTLRVAPTNTVLIDLTMQDSRSQVPENGIPLGVDENKVPIRATEFISANLKSKITVASGKAVPARGVETTPNSSGAQIMVIVGAQVLEPDAKAAK